MKAYIARETITFSNGESHIKGRTYFPTDLSQAYFDIYSSKYCEIEVKTIDYNGRIFIAPNHEMGYTKSYLLGYMASIGTYDPESFKKWMSGQTVGVSENGESVYYYNDIAKYLTKGGITAKVTD